MEGCRAATPDDLPTIVALAEALRDEVAPIRGGPLWARREAVQPPLEESYARLLADPEVCFLVGTVDDVVLGFALGVTERLHDGTPLGVIRDLYVEPEAREIGVGEELANRLVSFFAERGCVGVDAWALPGHRMTKNFFEDHGFVSRGIVVHRNLRDKPLEADNGGS